MADVPKWRAKGDWFDVCKCSIPCPCTFAQAPSEGDCDGILAWHIDAGHYGDVSLSGLSIVALSHFTGNIWAGAAKDWELAIYIDARADESQREAIQAIWSGNAGGWMRRVLRSDPGRARSRVRYDRIRGGGRPFVMASGDSRNPPGRGGRPDGPDHSGGSAGASPQPPWIGSRTWPSRHVGNGHHRPRRRLRFQMGENGEVEKHFPFDWSGPGKG